MCYRKLIVLLFIGMLVSGCSSDADAEIHISDPWVRAAAMVPAQDADMQTEAAQNGEEEMALGSGANSAAFMVIENRGAQTDRLLAAASTAAAAVEIHLSRMEGDVMVMRQVDGIEIPARGEIELKPGSYHIMLIGINRDLNPGDIVELSLQFERAPSETIQAAVRMP